MCLDKSSEGYISEFAVDTVKYYSEAEREFLKAPRGMFLLSLQLSIKILIGEKGILNMNSDD